MFGVEADALPLVIGWNGFETWCMGQVNLLPAIENIFGGEAMTVERSVLFDCEVLIVIEQLSERNPFSGSG